MADQFAGTIEVLDSTSTHIRIQLVGDDASLSAGGAGEDGSLVLVDGAGQERIRILAQSGRLVITTASGVECVRLDGTNGNLTLGGGGADGDVTMRSAAGATSIRLNADRPSLVLYNATDAVATIALDGRQGNATFGGSGHDGDITIKAAGSTRRASDVVTIRLSGDRPNMWMINPDDGVTTIAMDGRHGNVVYGASGHDGDVTIKASSGANSIRLNGDRPSLWMNNAEDGLQTIAFDGRNGNAVFGGREHDGDITLKASGGTDTIRLSGDRPRVWLNNPDDGVETIAFDGRHGNVVLGGSGHDGDLSIRNSSGDQTIALNGDTGDIVLSNADFAEAFDLADGLTPEGGTIMTLHSDGTLQPSATEYDRRVIGVVAGAGSYRPGVVLDERGDRRGRTLISVLGKVSCRADATLAPIEVGDLLTTSPTVGHAMKATDEGRAFGSIIGKALSPLPGGVGFVDMFVTLR